MIDIFVRFFPIFFLLLLAFFFFNLNFLFWMILDVQWSFQAGTESSRMPLPHFILMGRAYVTISTFVETKTQHLGAVINKTPDFI